jgi:hypothetical protein
MTSSNSNNNPLDRLEQLSQQRTARTQALWDAVQSLCARLDGCTEVGDCASCDAGRLIRRRFSTNVASNDFWCWETREVDDNCGEIYWDSVVLDGCGVGQSWYLHGDFYCELRSAGRKELLDFAPHASALVKQLVKCAEHTIERLDEATKQI